jgi:hypothetical protein
MFQVVDLLLLGLDFKSDSWQNQQGKLDLLVGFALLEGLKHCSSLIAANTKWRGDYN